MAASTAPAGDLLAGLSGSGGGLLVEGSPGIGKTRLWRDLVDQARSAGTQVLVACPVQAEARLAGGGLIDLLRDVPDGVIEQVPGPQSRALLTALLRREPDGAPPDPGTVAVAFASVLRILADAEPLLIAVDDLQWLDLTTAGVLGYVARRDLAGVRFAMTLRTAVEGDLSEAFSGELPSPAAELDGADLLVRHEVALLDPATISAIVLERSGHDLSRTVLARATEASGGNPFFAVELARMWASEPGDAASGWPIPASLRALVDARLDGLGDAGLHAVTVASALARPTVPLLAGLGITEAAIVAAERADVLDVEQGRIRFRHPIIAAAAYDALTGSERAALHRRLTEVVEDVELRARHLALGAEGPDEAVAAELDAASVSATARGDTHAATDAARLAIRATPPGSASLPVREFRLARLLFVAGDSEAQPLLERLTGPDVPDAVRGPAQVTMCELACSTISHEAAQAYGTEAVETATRLGDDTLLAEAYIYLSQAHQFEPARARSDAATAQRILEGQDDPDPSQLSKALALSAGIDFNLGLGLDHGRLQRAKDLEDAAGTPAEDRMTGYYAAMCIYADDLGKAREIIKVWNDENLEYGYERDHTVLLMWSTTLELASGNLDRAEVLAAEHLAYAELSGQAQAGRFARYNQGMAAVMRGDFKAAAVVAEALIEEADAGAGSRIEAIGRRLAGEAALAGGDHAAALAQFSRVEELRSPEMRDPSALAHLPKLIEAKLALGLEVETELTYYETQAEAVERSGAQAMAARCRATAALAAADEEGALDALDDAVRFHQKTGYYPVELARTLMLRGQALRRFRRKAGARGALVEARDLCDSLGSPGWVALIDAELDRVGGSARMTDELTATEQRVAELAGSGRTNKEIAAALFLSPKTVEVHLTRVYRKLGLRSRTELAARA